jgi:hypothetical protein
MDEMHRALAREITRWRRFYSEQISEQLDRVHRRNLEIERLRRALTPFAPELVDSPHGWDRN